MSDIIRVSVHIFSFSVRRNQKGNLWNMMLVSIKIFTFGFGGGRLARRPIRADGSTAQKLTVHSRNGTFSFLRN
jgi:hypothetical protein